MNNPTATDTIVIDVEHSSRDEIMALIVYLMDSNLEWSLQDYIGRGDDL